MPSSWIKALARSGRHAWLNASVAWLVAYGTERYPPAIRARLKILNVVAYLTVFFTLIYAIQFAFKGFTEYAPVVYANLAIVAVAMLVPFAHRYNEVAGALMIALTEIVAMFVFTALLGRNSGVQLQYFACPAAFFVIFGLERLRLILLLTVLSTALHLAAWFLYPQELALIELGREDLASLYVTAALTTFTMVAAVVWYAFRLAEQAQGQTDALLHNILPSPIVGRLKEKPAATIADSFEEASVLFADLKGFVPLAKSLGPERTVGLLNELMHRFDHLAVAHGVEKIKTIGDAYMVAAGVPEPAADHACRVAHLSLAMLDAVKRIGHGLEAPLAVRIGIASGPVLAGVIGAKRLTYDVWGDTVNLASRLEGHSLPGRVLVAHETKQRLDGVFELEPHGTVDIKGFGTHEAWFLGQPLVAAPDASDPAPLPKPGRMATKHGV